MGQGPLSILVFSSLLFCTPYGLDRDLSTLSMFLSGQVLCKLHIKSTHSFYEITSICSSIILSLKVGQPIPQKFWYHRMTLGGVKIQRQSDDHLFLHWTCRCLFNSFILFWDGVLLFTIVKLCIYFLSFWQLDDVSDNIHGILHCHCIKSRERNMILGQEPWVCSDYRKIQTGNLFWWEETLQWGLWS